MQVDFPKSSYAISIGVKSTSLVQSYKNSTKKTMI